MNLSEITPSERDLKALESISEQPKIDEKKERPSEKRTVASAVRIEKTLLASAAKLLFEEGYLPKNRSYIINHGFSLLLKKAEKEPLSLEEAEELINKWEL